MQFFSHLDFAHQLWKQIVQPGDLLIDATCGNGHDTLFLSRLNPNQLFALDIQREALEATRQRLEKELPRELLDKVQLVHGCHSRFPAEIEPASARLIVYNLGYLPGSDKTTTTNCASTLSSLQKALELLMPGGLISIACYPGHAEGALEEAELLTFASQLDKEIWSASQQRWLNRSQAPSLLLLQKTSHPKRPHNRE